VGKQLKKLICAVAILLLPSNLSVLVLNTFGHRVGRGAKMGFSWIFVERLVVSASAKIGHANFISAKRLVMRDAAKIGRSNLVNGPLSLHLSNSAALGNNNKVTRAALGVVYGPAKLSLGTLSKITANHRIDCTCSVIFGEYSTLGGAASQVWTHGYVHDLEGVGRYRVDGRCVVGDNVYIGSMALISAGVTIGSGAIIGAGSVLAKSVDGNAMYVSSALRKMPRPVAPESRADLKRVPRSVVIEPVFKKAKIDRT